MNLDKVTGFSSFGKRSRDQACASRRRTKLSKTSGESPELRVVMRFHRVNRSDLLDDGRFVGKLELVVELWDGYRCENRDDGDYDHQFDK